MQKRLIGIYFVITLLFTVSIFRVYYINISDDIVASASVQGRYTVEVARTRGMIYDTNMDGLVNQEYKYLASVMPTVQAAGALLPIAEEAGSREALVAKLTGISPFVMEVPDNTIYANGVDIFRVPKRYGARQIAPHIVGYLSGDGVHGVSGIEKAYDEFFIDTGLKMQMKYQTDAAGKIMKGSGGVERSADTATGGVVLTIDSRIQKIVANALRSGCDKGAAVVMDVYNGDILAMDSIPVFDQRDIAASFDSTDAPFINRAVSGYNIGSAFKIIVSTAALEYGIPETYKHYCSGYTEINDRTFRCNNNAIHGELDMKRALQVSCNTYFIDLAKQMSPSYLASVARYLGLGSAMELAPGMMTQAGNIPDISELANETAYANFSFGQGSSLASPLQMAQAASTIVNSGMSVTPRLVKGFTLDGLNLAEQTPVYSANQIISERTSKLMRGLLASVVSDGSGRTAKPLQGGAGGKTSSAQTGQFIGDEEIVHAWFVGFYPAAHPQFSITVFVEGGLSGEKVAAPIFRQIADGISGLKTSAIGYSA